MFSINNLCMKYGERILFKDVSLHFQNRARYGLVGANGAGKTTFLKILGGELTPDSGIIAIPKEYSIGRLEQDYIKYSEIKIRDLVLMGDKKLWEALKKRKEILDSNLDELNQIEEVIETRGGYHAEAEVSRLLEGMGIPKEKHDQPLLTLSGGYQLRVLLAKILFSNPDLLLLDEPTNYLDIFSIEWLESYLMDYPGILILSSHDHLFINRVSTHILDVDYCTVTEYEGNFDHFTTEKEEKVKLKENTLAVYAKRKDEIQQFVDRFRYKASKARQAQSRCHLLKKLEEEEKAYEIFPTSRLFPKFHFPIERASGRIILSVEGIQKAFGELSVLNAISFEIERGEKVAIVGPNGIGKSTLLKIITDHLQADAGHYKWGLHTKWAYFPQNFHQLLSPDATLYDWISSYTGSRSNEKVRQTLGAILFNDKAINKEIRTLSGGEGARLVFAAFTLLEKNILILDEPTNHLDIESKEALIEALQKYKGTLIFVSHDRYFLSKVADRILEVHFEGVDDFQGGYNDFTIHRARDYLDRKQARQIMPKKKNNEEKPDSYEERKKKRSEVNKLKKQIGFLENKNSNLEKSLESLNARLIKPGFYENTPPNELSVILEKRGKLESEQRSIEKEWEHQMAILEGLEKSLQQSTTH